MPWVRFDDQFPIHRRVAGLSDGAFRLHVAAIFWCARNLTDGFVSAGDVVNVGGSRRPYRLVDELVGAGAWHVADGGWQIHDYLEYQPSRTKVLDRRALRAKSGQIGGVKSGESRRSARQRSKPEAKPKQDASRSLEPRTSFLPRKEDGRGGAYAAPPTSSQPHPYTDDLNGTCTNCQLPKTNRVHIHAVEDTA